MLKKLTLFIVILICFLGCAPKPKKPIIIDTEITEDFYKGIYCGVIRVGRPVLVRSEGSSNQWKLRISPEGTAFFICHKSDIFVVTARHVTDKNYDLNARVQVTDTKTGVEKNFLLNLPRDRWVYHPESGDETTHYVDVAAMKICLLPGYGITCFGYNPQEPKEHAFPRNDPQPPTPVLVFGFPVDIGFQLADQRPLGRFGIVSMVSGKKFIKINSKFTERKAYIIDANIFSGNSGSPVYRQPSVLNPSIRLLGLVFGSNDALDFAMVEPASRIGETIDITATQSIEGVNFWTGPLQ